MNKRAIGWIIFLYYLPCFAIAQERIIEGQLIQRIQGCQIVLKGTKIGTVTDNTGKYKIVIPDSLQLNKIELSYNAVGWTNNNVDFEKKSAFTPNSSGSVITVSSDLSTNIKAAIPTFPWPPPAASAQDVMDKSMYADLTTLGALSEKLRKTLQSLGYFEKSYYAVPGGFALVTRLERIKEDEPVPLDPPDRWNVNSKPAVRSIADYIKQLFTAPNGYFRVIVFFVTDQNFASAPQKEISREQALAWFKTGSNVLPASIGNLPLSNAHDCSVLIYEFKKADNKDAEFLALSRFPGRQHLDKFYKAFSLQ